MVCVETHIHSIGMNETSDKLMKFVEPQERLSVDMCDSAQTQKENSTNLTPSGAEMVVGKSPLVRCSSATSETFLGADSAANRREN